MPKMKTVSSAKKRFRFTSKGRVKFKRGYHSHILTSKSTKKKREQRKGGIMTAVEEPRVKRMLPYGG